jgi:hypothetical protein
MGIEYCQNTVASQRMATERAREAEEQVTVQTKVVDALKAQLLEQAETLARVTKFSLESAAAAATNAVPYARGGRDSGQCVAREEGEAGCKKQHVF